MTEEWLKRQTQKMIVEFNRYIWGSDNDTHKNHVCLIQRASHEILHNFRIHMSIQFIIINTLQFNIYLFFVLNVQIF